MLDSCKLKSACNLPVIYNKKIHTAGTSNADVPLADPGMYQLDITLKRGQSLAARDRGGTSDPYVKFKIGGKEVFRSKIIHKNLNPVWEEKACLLVDHLREPLYIKVFDYDFGLQDDFMGSAFLDLTQLELNRPTDVTLTLKDPHYPDHDLGTILLSVILTPKEGEHRDVTMLMRKSWKRSSKELSENEVVGSYFSVKSFFWRTRGRPAFPIQGFCRAELQSAHYQNAHVSSTSLFLFLSLHEL